MHIWMPMIKTGTGAEVYAKRLSSGLISRGHEVQLELYPHFLQYCPWLAPAFLPAKCEIIIANSWSAKAFERSGVPLVTIMHHVVHGSDLRPYKSLPQKAFHAGFIRPMESAAIAASKAIVAVSESTANATRAEFGYSSVHTILNAVDTEFFKPNGNKSRDSRTPLRLLFVGKPSRRKGFDTVASFCEAMGSRAELVMAGPAQEEILPCVQAIRLGRVTDCELRDEYRKADFLLLPSHVEGFGYVAAEAMACGTPVLCLAGGAVEEVVCPPNGGILLNPEDLTASAETVCKIANDPDQMMNLRRNARSIAMDRFTVGRWLDEFESLLSSLVPAH